MFGCSNEPNVYDGIAMHSIPFGNNDRLEAKKRRNVWVNFVKEKRAKWTPTSTSVICSKHFKPEDFARQFVGVHHEEKPMFPRLKKASIGVCVCPSIMFPGGAKKSVGKRSPSACKYSKIFFYLRYMVYIYTFYRLFIGMSTF